MFKKKKGENKNMDHLGGDWELGSGRPSVWGVRSAWSSLPLLPSTLASLSFLSPLLLLISSACPPIFICSSSSSVPSSSQSSSPAPAPSNCCLSGRDNSLFRVTDSCPRVGKSVRGVLSSVSCDRTPLLGLSECKRRRCHRAKESKGERQWRFSHYLIKLTKVFAYFE